MFAGPSESKGKKQKEKEARAPQVGPKIKTKDTMANLQKFQPGEEESKEKEEEIATHLGGGDPLKGHSLDKPQLRRRRRLTQLMSLLYPFLFLSFSISCCQSFNACIQKLLF